MDLVTFLWARLNEDEAAAKAARDVSRWPWQDAEWSDQPEAHIAHYARHDPARVLREVEAKRGRLALYVAAEDALAEVLRDAPPEESPATAHSYVRERIKVQQASGRFIALEASVRLDAAVWSDHPDYDPAWSPTPRTS